MILRKGRIRIFTILILGLAITEAQNSRSYDTSDWIPIAKPCADCSAGQRSTEKRATGRVLNLPEAPQKNFFPKDDYRSVRQAENYQQYLRETLLPNQFKPPVQHQKQHKDAAQQQRQKPQNQNPNVQISQVPLQQYYVTQGPLNSNVEFPNQQPAVQSQPQQQNQYDLVPQQILNSGFLQSQNLLKQNYPSLATSQQFSPQQSLSQQQPPQYELSQQQNLQGQQQSLQLNPAGDSQKLQEHLQQIQKQAQHQKNVSLYNPLGLGVQTINDALLGENVSGRYEPIDITSTTSKAEKQNVQLLYVPLEQLQNKQQTRPQNINPASTKQAYQQSEQPSIADYENSFQHKQHQLLNIEKDFIQQALEAHKLQQKFEQGNPTYFLDPSTLPPTTLKPVSRKRRPHQPPLAVYMGGHRDAQVTDVLNVLKNAKSIDVQDSVGPSSPRVFVGPANLDPPDGYSKFDLPYLSNLDSNRVERKVDHLPFFVAPLNYKTPPGYSKIPLPSPHVGSVVVAQKQLHEKLNEEEPSVVLNFPSQNANQYHVTPATPIPERQNVYTTPVDELYANVNSQIRNELRASAPTPTATEEEIPQYYVRRQPTRTRGRQHHRNRVHESLISAGERGQKHETNPSLSFLDFPNEEVPEATHKSPQTSSVTQNPEIHLQNVYAEIHNVPSISTTPIPTTQIRQNQQSNAVRNFYSDVGVPRYSSTLSPAPQIRQKQQTSPQNFYSGFDEISGFSSTPLPKPNGRRNQQQALQQFYAELDSIPSIATPTQVPSQAVYEPVPVTHSIRSQTKAQELPADIEQLPQRNIQDVFSIIPPAPSAANNQPENQELGTGGFDLGQFRAYSQPQKTAGDFQNFDQLFQSAYLANPSLNQVENLSRQSTTTPKSSSVENTSKHTLATPNGQAEEKYTVLEEFSAKPKTTTLGDSNTGNEFALNYESYSPNPALVQTRFAQAPTAKSVDEDRSPFAHTETPNSHSGRNRQRLQSQNNYESPNAYLPVKSHHEDYRLSPQLPAVNPILPGLINDLQDQSVRQLLAPVLLAPTSTEKGLKSSSVRYSNSPTEKSHVATIDYVYSEPVTSNVAQQPSIDYHYSYPTTTAAPEASTLPVVFVETTTERKQRGRGRGGSRYNLRTPTTSVPRRNAQRARTQHPSRNRSRQDHVVPTATPRSTTISHTTTEASRRTPTRQRFKTRGRPLQNEDNSASISEKVNAYSAPATPANEEVPQIQPALPQPNSYYELEQPAPKPHLIIKSKTLSPEEEYLIKKYNLAYTLTGDSDNQHTPVNNVETFDKNPQTIVPYDQDSKTVDIQLTHPVAEVPSYTSSSHAQNNRGYLPTEKQQSSSYRTTEHTPSRTRSRIRGRPKIATKPSTTTSTTTPRIEKITAAQDEEDQEEFYGFFRHPTYANENRAKTTTHAPFREPIYSPSYISSTIQVPANRVESGEKIEGVEIYTNSEKNPSTSVQFIGEIRPKYQHSTSSQNYEATTEQIPSTTKYFISTKATTVAAKRKIRGRIRVPTRKNYSREDSSEATSQRAYADEAQTSSEEITTRRSSQRVRGRGRAHFNLPDQLKQQTNDEDVEGGNYPVQFIKPQESASERPSFMITIDPAYDDEREDDQVPYSSIYRPKILPVDPKWSSNWPNDIPTESKVGKGEFSTVEAITVRSAANDDVVAEDLEETVTALELQATTTSASLQATTTSVPKEITDKNPRRGYWRLVKHKPVDDFETAESQNVGVISANSFTSEDKEYKEQNKFEPGTENQSTSREREEAEREEESRVIWTTDPNYQETTTSPTKTTQDFFQAIYETFGFTAAKIENVTTTTARSDVTASDTTLAGITTKASQVTTTTPTPLLPDEITETVATETATDVPVTTGFPAEDAATERNVDAASSVQQNLHPWNMGVVRTSTSTEISHETEICYKGVCIKSKDIN